MEYCSRLSLHGTMHPDGVYKYMSLQTKRKRRRSLVKSSKGGALTKIYANTHPEVVVEIVTAEIIEHLYSLHIAKVIISETLDRWIAFWVAIILVDRHQQMRWTIIYNISRHRPRPIWMVILFLNESSDPRGRLGWGGPILRPRLIRFAAHQKYVTRRTMGFNVMSETMNEHRYREVILSDLRFGVLVLRANGLEISRGPPLVAPGWHGTINRTGLFLANETPKVVRHCGIKSRARECMNRDNLQVGPYHRSSMRFACIVIGTSPGGRFIRIVTNRIFAIVAGY